MNKKYCVSCKGRGWHVNPITRQRVECKLCGPLNKMIKRVEKVVEEGSKKKKIIKEKPKSKPTT